MPKLIFVLVMVVTGFVDVYFMHNMPAALMMTVGTWLVAYLSYVIMFSACENEGPGFKLFVLWLRKGGKGFTFFASIIAVAAALLIAVVISKEYDKTIYWIGFVIALIPVVCSIFIGGLAGVHSWNAARQRIQ